MKTKKNEFIEIEFTGKIKDTGEIFDTNIKEEAQKIDSKAEPKPIIVCIGEGMLVKGFDKALEEKETGKKYTIELSSEDSFGKKDPKMIKLLPMSVFKQQNLNPAPGMIFNFDNIIARIITVSGGRILTDFNNPLSGKEITYEFTIKRIISDENEKINSLQDFFFKKRFDFSINDKKITFNKEAEPFLKLFKEKFKELLKKEIDVKNQEKTANKEDKTVKNEEKTSKQDNKI